ncbi:MAG: hypothetical protein RLZZ234_844 [Candidatus Parcubacteria bacterium]|jgi:hypothetical protein
MTDLTQQVKEFLAEVDLAKNPQAWNGLMETLRRPATARVHGACAAAALRAKITRTKRIKSSDPLMWSSRLQTSTSLAPEAREEIIRQLGLEGLHD